MLLARGRLVRMWTMRIIPRPVGLRQRVGSATAVCLLRMYGVLLLLVVVVVVASTSITPLPTCFFTNVLNKRHERGGTVSLLCSETALPGSSTEPCMRTPQPVSHDAYIYIPHTLEGAKHMSHLLVAHMAWPDKEGGGGGEEKKGRKGRKKRRPIPRLQ